MDSLFKYIDIPQEKRVRLVAFELNDTTFSCGKTYRIEEELQESNSYMVA